MIPELAPETYLSPEFLRMALTHLFRDASVINTAKELKVSPEDFVASNTIGLQAYKDLASIALSSTGNPMTKSMVELLVTNRINTQEILPQQQFMVRDLVNEIYAANIDADSSLFIVQQMPMFIKHRREARALIEHGDDANALFENLSRIRTEIQQVSDKNDDCIIDIFAENKMPEIIQFVPTGIPELDASLGGGLGVGEYGQIIGFSGGGKTTLGVTLISNAAMAGYNAMYISREEGESGITNRFRAKNYGLSYSKLRSGAITKQELDQITEEKHHIRDRMSKHMRLMNARDFNVFNSQTIIDRIEARYKSTGWAPALLVIDQLDYVSPIEPKKNEQEWEKYSRTAFELDQKVSHYLVGGVHPMSIWVLHQAKGKEKRIFTVDEITGFKGIIKPADLALGIGRDKDMFNLFTLKARHGPRFELPMESNLEYMEFVFGGQRRSGGMFHRDNDIATSNNSRNIFAKK